ncbi:hypothetical protein MOQ_001657, partial [Trypanosoma cruzi marinkellei]
MFLLLHLLRTQRAWLGCHTHNRTAKLHGRLDNERSFTLSNRHHNFIPHTTTAITRLAVRYFFLSRKRQFLTLLGFRCDYTTTLIGTVQMCDVLRRGKKCLTAARTEKTTAWTCIHQMLSHVKRGKGSPTAETRRRFCTFAARVRGMCAHLCRLHPHTAVRAVHYFLATAHNVRSGAQTTTIRACSNRRRQKRSFGYRCLLRWGGGLPTGGSAGRRVRVIFLHFTSPSPTPPPLLLLLLPTH